MTATRDFRTGLEWLRPSRVLCLSEHSRVEVKWKSRKQCWVGESGDLVENECLQDLRGDLQSKEIGR